MSEGEAIPDVRPTKSKRKRIFVILASAFILGLAALYGYSRYQFPYGASHACAINLGSELQAFAGDNNHWFPNGEKTPEASLSLLYTNDLERASHMLAGKTVSQKVARKTLQKFGRISPATCGWHYVEGLRDDDDPQIAIAWDKAIGLGHNGQRTKNGMHEVVLVGYGRTFIGKSGWPEFVAIQKKLLTQTIASRDTNAPAIRWSDEEDLGPNRFSPK